MNLFGGTKKVLVADDEEDIRVYLKKYLERRRLKTTLARDGEEAKAFIEKESFDYFLLDCSMPNITGLELIQLARRRNPGAKIILISGFPSVDGQVVKNLGGDIFVHKPIQMADLDRIFEEKK